MLSRNLFTSRGDDLGTGFVPNGNRIDRATIAGAQQSLPFDRVGIHENRGAGFVEHKGFGSFGNAVAESDAQRPIDPDPQLTDRAFFEVAHIPSSPSSARAVSMIVGVISVIPRSRA